MLVFLKAQASSLIATLVDFIFTIILVEIFNQHYIVASVAGAIAGAVTNFIVNRQWVFRSKEEAVQKQSVRYILVWLGSLTLNTSGIYILTHFITIKYFISKIIISLIVGIGFNYVLQKNYVFIPDEPVKK